jgi:DNA ligase-1
VLLSEVASTSAEVAGTSSRRAKTGYIAALLARVTDIDDVPIAVAFLSGDLTQRQIGVGYAALVDLTGDAGFPPRGPAVTEVPDDDGSLTLAETDSVFEAIGAAGGPGSQAQRRQLLAGLISRATDSEQRFLFRLIAGDLGQGALEGVMVEAVAQAAGVPAAEVRRAHQLRGSLPEVAKAALAASARSAAEGATPAAAEAAVTAVLRGFTLTIGQPVRPMLAASAPTIEAALDQISPAILDWKIDGVRIQIHKDQQQVRVFTRTLDDITARIPEIVDLALSLEAECAVVDGEAIALRADSRPHPFQVTSARMASQAEPGAAERGAAARPVVPLTAFLFDLLHADGQDLIDEPAGERFRHLAAIAPPGLLIPRIVTSDPQRAREFFDDAVSRGHEGVVVKAVDAPYGAGRRGGDWIKVKPRITLDLVILAAEWGHGRRTGLLSNLHLGARDPATGGFVMLGKTFKGLTDAMLAWQTERLLELADPPAPAVQQHGVVRVRPELVAEIAFDGVQASRRYPGGVALRFARVLRYRTDKRPDEADTIDAVRAFWAGDTDVTE